MKCLKNDGKECYMRRDPNTEKGVSCRHYPDLAKYGGFCPESSKRPMMQYIIHCPSCGVVGEYNPKESTVACKNCNSLYKIKFLGGLDFDTDGNKIGFTPAILVVDEKRETR